MSRLAKALILGLLGSVLGAGLGLTRGSLDIEEDIGLTWLFKQRGVRAAPPEVVIIAMDKTSADHLHLSNEPGEWSRILHTRLVRNLSSAGAKVVAFDVLFKKAGLPHEDKALAAAIKDAGNVILFEQLKKESRPVKDSLEIDDAILIGKLIEPIPELAGTAVALAPFPLPKVPYKVSQYWKYSPDAGDVPTLPVVTMQYYLLDVYEEFLQLIKQHRPEYAATLPRSRDEILQGMGVVEFARMLHRTFVLDPGISNLLLETLNKQSGRYSATGKRVLEAFVALYQGERSQYLNFYGPPRSITTIPYYQALALEDTQETESAQGITRNFFRDKIVFIGESAAFQWEQKDGFYSVFSQQSGLDISGVEIAATAAANLLENFPVKPLNIYTQVLLIILWGLVLGLLCGLLPAIWATLTVILLSITYFAIAAYQFNAMGLWLPLVVPLMFQMPLILFAAVLWDYRDTNRERRQVRQMFGYYLPQKVVDRLARGISHLKPGGQLVYGICLATDAEQYTALSENMPPEKLADLMNEYYEAIFGPVRTHGGIISDVKGDAMLALWASATLDHRLRSQACLAALGVKHAVKEFNRENPGYSLPTRIGMHCGSILLGNVGALDHYEYRAVGDIVNTSTRIEGMNKNLGTQLLVSEEIIEDLDEFLSRKLGKFILTGKTNPITLYELICEKEKAEDTLCQLCGKFEQALRAFNNQEWDEASAGFSGIITTYQEDIPSRVYLALCEQYRNVPPQSDWTGIVNFQQPK